MNGKRQHAFDPEELMAYLDGELRAQRAVVLAGHLEHCTECQEVARSFRLVSERLLHFEVEPPPVNIATAVLGAPNSASCGKTMDFDCVPRVKPSYWAGLWASRNAWALAAVVLILLIVAAFPILHQSREARVASRSGAPNSVNALARPEPGVSPVDEPSSRAKVESQEFAQPRPAALPPPPQPVAGPSGKLAAPETVGPMIVQTASLNIVARNYDEASAAIEELAAARGGYVEKLVAKAQNGTARERSLTLRIPAKALDEFLADLRKLGHVDEESQSNEEISAEYVDLQARLHSAQATERRLITLLGTRTGKLEDVLDAERELSRVRGEIESMQGQSAVLVHKVGYATVEVELSEEYHEKLQSGFSTGTRLWNALIEGLQNLNDGIVGVLVFLLNYGLSILFWIAILLLPSWLLWRRFRPS